MESFCVTGRCAGLDAAQAHETLESLRLEPASLPLTGECPRQDVDLLAGHIGWQADKEVGRDEVALVLGNLVLPDEVVTESLPGDLSQQSVILMEVISPGREHDVGRSLALEFLEHPFYCASVLGKPAVAKTMQLYPTLHPRRDDRCRTGASLIRPFPLTAEDAPGH